MAMRGTNRREALRLAAATVSALSLPIEDASAQAQPTGPSTGAGWLLVTGRSFDAAQIRTYSLALPPAYAEAGGRYVAVGGPGRGVTWIEGPLRDRSLILARFADVTFVERFWWSETYRRAVRLRDRAGVFNALALAGEPMPAGWSGPPALLAVLLAESSFQPDGRVGAALDAAGRAAGARVLVNAEGAGIRGLEGDTAWSRVWIGAWPDSAARDAFIAGRTWRAASRLARASGLLAVASVTGLPPGGPAGGTSQTTNTGAPR